MQFSLISKRMKVLLIAILLSICCLRFSFADSPIGCAGWINQGPFRVSDFNQATENIPNASIIGAVSSLVLNGDVAFIGTTNGGVWKTDNIHANYVHWYSSTDMQPITCTSIGGLTIDPFESQHVVAACSPVSSWTSQFSELNGLMETFDGGKTWSMLGGDFPLDLGVPSVVIPAPKTILAGVKLEFKRATRSNSVLRGVWHSIDGGRKWTKVALPGIDVNDNTTNSAIFRLVADPLQSQFVLALSRKGVHLTRDGGQTWTLSTNGLNVGSEPVSLTVNAVASIANVPLANGTVQRVLWVGFTSCPDNCVFGVWRSLDDGRSWSKMTEPGTNETAGFYGLGDQGFLHFALAGDPTDIDTCYVGGSTQLILGPDGILNAQTYSGRLFRGNFAADTWTPLTHTGTASRSSPHADSRWLVFDPMSGHLLHTCDGGVYMRTSPRSTQGDWFVLNGDLAISEYNSVSINPRTGVIAAGAQDNGPFISSPASQLTGTVGAGSVNGIIGFSGDGGFSLADPVNDRIYLTAQFLFLGITNSYGTNATFVDFENTLLAEVSGPFQPILLLNPHDSNRFMTCVIGTIPGCFDVRLKPSNEIESVKRVATDYLEGVDYGGQRNGEPDAEFVLGISATTVFRRYSSPIGVQSESWPAPLAWGHCIYLTANPMDFTEAVAVCTNTVSGSQVYLTTNFGSNWTVITGDLYGVSGTRWNLNARSTSIVVLPDGARAYLAGTSHGLFVTFSDAPGSWQRVGSQAEFPNVTLTQIRHDRDSDLLLVSTIGRGAWSIQKISGVLQAMHQGNTCPISVPLSFPYDTTPTDCMLGDWLKPSSCSASCGSGVNVQLRSVVTPALHGGQPCPFYEPLYQLCNTQACPDTQVLQSSLESFPRDDYSFLNLPSPSVDMCNVTVHLAPVKLNDNGFWQYWVSTNTTEPTEESCVDNGCLTTEFTDVMLDKFATTDTLNIGMLAFGLGQPITAVFSVSGKPCPAAPITPTPTPTVSPSASAPPSPSDTPAVTPTNSTTADPNNSASNLTSSFVLLTVVLPLFAVFGISAFVCYMRYFRRPSTDREADFVRIETQPPRMRIS